MTTIKMISSKGQLDLGEEYSDRQVLVEQVEPGVWLIKVGQFIPDNEQWLHQPHVKTELDEAISWAQRNPPQSSDLDDLVKRVE
ncbi:hypothetical protein KJ068_09755 [bacterium]|nr:hypothetical protein [bacterium]